MNAKEAIDLSIKSAEQEINYIEKMITEAACKQMVNIVVDKMSPGAEAHFKQNNFIVCSHRKFGGCIVEDKHEIWWING